MAEEPKQSGSVDPVVNESETPSVEASTPEAASPEASAQPVAEAAPVAETPSLTAEEIAAAEAAVDAVAEEAKADTAAPIPPVAESKRPLRQGEAATGRIIKIHGGEIFVEFGGKDQGICPKDNFPDGLPKIGESLEFRLNEYMADEGLWKLRLKGFGVGEVDAKALELGMTVEGRVTGMNTGGLELKIAGVRAFMPSSQIDANPVENFAPYLNTKLTCKIVELSGNRKRMVVSRRALLEEEVKAKRGELLEGLEVGAIVEGKVRSIQKFGAFVQIAAGVDGLVHISDISHSRVNKVEDVLKNGDVVKVKVLKVNKENGKISLGMKQVEPDPWSTTLESLKEGEEISGRVTRLADFGAFVEVGPGVEGLIPMSEMGWNRVEKASDVLTEGETVKVKVARIEAKKKRISLSLKALMEDPWSAAAEQFTEGSTVKGKVTKVMAFGAFLELAPGVEGLIHISALDGKRVNQVEDIAPVGAELEAKVLGIDIKSRKISLSRRALVAPEEEQKQNASKASRHDVRSHMKKQGNAKATESLGSLLEKFGGPDGGLKGGIG